ncbi:MAG: oligopeptide transporter, OPT family [Lachnospiraceae bacterium]|nr:oligopeptide transporter, OPT family [Lachnospiraceae bacterium]
MSENKEFKPFVPANKTMPEFTGASIILGILLAVLFGGANAYLGLRVGMTVSASIPAAVISMGVIRMILKKDSILENNMVQTIGSAGESVAAGVIFTLPAMFLWAKEWGTATPSLMEIAVIAFVGGTLGILFMVPLRKALIVQEHGTLPYPEGQACAEVLVAGEQGGAKASTVFSGLGIAAAYKFITDGLKVFPSEVHWEIPAYKGSGIGMDVLPALLGVGYICGPKISSYLFCGGFLGWFVLMPLIVLFGNEVILFPADVSIAELYATGGSFAIWTNYIKYIGAGAVACGGVLSLIKSLPLIVKTFRDAMKGFGKGTSSNERTNQDLDMKFILIGIVVLAFVMWLVPIIPINLFGAFLVIVFGFFFATVSSRMVGLVGSSNNPVSGMTIATLLVASIALKATGTVGQEGMTAAIVIGGIICIIAAIAGDTSQDLKTGYILGSTPKKQQIGELIGVLASSLAIGGVLYLLDKAWGYGSANLPAPQATLMKMIVEGVMGGNLPWGLIAIGACIALIVEFLGIPVLPFAIGLYLPIHLSTPMMVGGIVKWAIEKKKSLSDKEKKDADENGILFSSGLIAGEGLVGILLAVLAIIPLGKGSVGDAINGFLPGVLPILTDANVGNIIGLVAFALLTFCLWKFCFRKAKKA